jgi:hypothetical protein
MKTLVITTILALGVAAPAVAQSQLEQSVGAEAGQYSLSELVQLKQSETESGNEGRVFLGNDKFNFSAKNAHNGVAARIFADIAAEQSGNH